MGRKTGGAAKQRRTAFAIVVFLLALATLAASVINLLFIGVAGNPFVVSTCAVAAIVLIPSAGLDLSDNEKTTLFFSACGLALFGAADYSAWHGVTFSINAAASALVLLSAYVIARFLLRERLAYAFSLAGFLTILVPALYSMATGDVRLRELFTLSSENYATSWLIVTSVAMCGARIAEGKKPPLWPLVVTFLIAMSQYTRGSILVAFIALVAFAYVRIGFKWTCLMAFLLILGSIPMGDHIVKAVEELIASTKFGQRGFSSPRWVMWDSYVDYQTFGSLMLGTNTDNVPIIAEFNGNPHSSFIRFHAYFGILPLVAFIAILARRAVAVHPYLLIAPLLIVVRAASDILIIGTVLDVFFMMALVPVLLAKPRERKRVVRPAPVRRRSTTAERPLPDDQRQAA